jgi:outer membrane immunogenic protein
MGNRSINLVAAAVCAFGFGHAAFAADVPMVPVKAAAGPASYNWSGIYVGGHAGYGMGMKDWTNSIFDFDVKGFLGGGQIGVNQQVGNWVIGLEADASWAGIKGSQTIVEGGPLNGLTSVRTASSRIDRLATVAGRIGFAQDRWLVYFKGGAVWTHENHAFNALQTFTIIGGPPVNLVAAVAGSETRFGPMLGFGAEYALWGNWSFKSEYNYLYLPNGTARLIGTQTFFGVTAPVTIDANIQQAFHLVKLGLNYRFGPEAPPAIAPARPAPGYNWTGFYAGAEGGYGFGRKDWEAFAPNDQFNISGGLAGGVTGTNVQLGVFVFGVESEWMWSGVKGSTRFTQNLALGASQTTELSNRIDWLSLASLRAGFVAADRWLVYFKGGIALAHETHGIAATQVVPGLGSASINLSGSALHTGYLAGVGVEYAFWGNWSAKLEYNYIHFRPQAFTQTGPEVFNAPPLAVGTIGFAARESTLQHLHLVKLGVNYHFNAFPDAISAKY